MAFAGQTVDEITDTNLGYWSAEDAAAPPPPVGPGPAGAPSQDARRLARGVGARPKYGQALTAR